MPLQILKSKVHIQMKLEYENFSYITYKNNAEVY